MLTQFIKFSLVGVVNTAIHYAVFYYLYSVIGIYHLIASATGFLLAVMNSYIFNKHWTFNSSGNGGNYQFAKFVIVNVVSLSANLVGMFMLVELLFINPLQAQLVTICFTLVMNFIGNKFWSFKEIENVD